MLRSFSRSGILNRTRSKGVARAALGQSFERLESRCMFSAVAPNGLTAIANSSSSIVLQWNASPSPGVTGYDVFARIYAPGGGGKGGSHPGHYYFVQVGTNLTANSETITGLLPGTTHSYVVTAVDPSGQSPDSSIATAETWIAPSLPYGSAFLLSSGALYSAPVDVTAGQTTQLTILAGGNPLKYAVEKGPSSVSIDSKSGVVTYTPASSESGTVLITFKAYNVLGYVTQTVQFNVTAPNPNLIQPTLKLMGTALTYIGRYTGVTAQAIGTDGVTPVSGTFAFAYNGSTGTPLSVGTYGVLATFTSSDSRYANASLLGTITIQKATPTFSQLTPQTFAVDTPSVTFTGQLAAGVAIPANDAVMVALQNLTERAFINASGIFSATFSISTLPVGKYPVSYTYAGGSNFAPAPDASSTLQIIAGAKPRVRHNPRSLTVTAGDSATFTASASGSNPPSVQWQVSTNGGKKYTNIYSPYGSTLIVTAAAADNGNLYRAVFTNALGHVKTKAARLTVQADTTGSD